MSLGEDSSSDAESQPILQQPSKTPLPKTQLAVVLFLQLAEPIASTQIFPYINAMIEEMHIAPSNQVGFYSGLIESVALLLQLCTMVYWGSLSDRIGRKPVILISLFSMSAATLCFGTCNTLWQMILFRGLNAALCGNSAVLYSVASDITDVTNQHMAFPLTALTWYAGATIGSLIGGLLAQPAERYPTIFGSVALLRARPFLLPCIVSSLFTSASIIVAITLLKESHPHFRAAGSGGPGLSLCSTPRLYGSCESTNLKGPPPTSPQKSQTFRLLSNTTVRYILFARFLRDFLADGFDKIFTLWSYTPIPLGGLERNPAEIGMILSISQILGMFIIIVVFPYLCSRYNNVSVFAGCMPIWGLVFTLMPLVGIVAQKKLHFTRTYDNPPTLGGLWGLVLLVLVVERVGVMTFPASLLMVNDMASDCGSAGTLFGLVTAAGTLGSGIAPAITSSLFALSIQEKVLGGNLVWIVMVCLSILAAIFAQTLKRRM